MSRMSVPTIDTVTIKRTAKLYLESFFFLILCYEHDDNHMTTIITGLFRKKLFRNHGTSAIIQRCQCIPYLIIRKYVENDDHKNVNKKSLFSMSPLVPKDFLKFLIKILTFQYYLLLSACTFESFNSFSM